jgi:hypothetical protein
MGMFGQTTMEHVSWHAGLRDVEEDAPSIASTTWPRGRVTNELDSAVSDCLRTLAVLNRELNNASHSDSASTTDLIPRQLVYAMTEITRMLRECQVAAKSQQDAATFAQAVWRIETAWSAVLAGDAFELLDYVAQEELARNE